jgi:hypothetical protein
VAIDGEVGPRAFPERSLRRRIREHDLSGHERVRRVDEPDPALRPLHTRTLYQEVHGVAAAALAEARSPGAARRSTQRS